jgi:SAM-dependent methyltransferase
MGLPQEAWVLDAGCGNGRNSVYLGERGHHIIGVDFSSAALMASEDSARRSFAADRLSFARVDLFKRLPFADNRFDLSLDSYVSCHFIDQQRFDAYWKELTRVTKPGGMIFTSMFSIDDEYYANLAGGSALSHLVTDPFNNVTKRLHNEATFKSLFLPPLKVVYFIKFQFPDTVLGHSYTRSIFVSLIKRLA